MAKIYHSLESEKYLMSTIHDQHHVARQQARANASKSITNFIIIALAITAGYFAIQSMPVWLPTAETSFHEWTNYKFIR